MNIPEHLVYWKEYSEKGATEPSAEAKAKKEADAVAAFQRANQRMAELRAEAEAVAAAHRSEVDPRKQALYDTAFLVGAADGSFSDAERAKLAAGIQGLFEESADAHTISVGLETARGLFQEKGLKGAAADIAERIPDEHARYALLTIASVVAWLGGGVGTKEGLALQAIAAAFGIPIPKLHEVMAGAARIAKA